MTRERIGLAIVEDAFEGLQDSQAEWSRRDFLAGTIVSAALPCLGPMFPPPRKLDFLESAIQVANWLDSVAMADGNCLRWPIAPDIGLESTDNLYAGTAGIVAFYVKLWEVTNSHEYLNRAIVGANALINAVSAADEKSDPGLFTGLAGVAWVLNAFHLKSDDAKYRNAAVNVFDHFEQRIKRASYRGHETASWNNVTDIIAGNAGIGIYLLSEWRDFENRAALRLSQAVGDGLLAAAHPVELASGEALKWMMSPDFPREMPNYSHGTAGICDFLCQLDEICRNDKVDGGENYDGRFLNAARSGAEYLIGLCEQSSSGMIPHHFPDGRDLYYVGWCHGPAGTVRLLDRLGQITADPRYGNAAETLIRSLHESELPARRGDGFWNNVGVCCGNCGIAAALIGRDACSSEDAELAKALLADMMNRASAVDLPNAKTGLKWVQAEHRVKPDLLQAQTGLMQGAAGIGLTLLRFHERENGQDLKTTLPCLPF